MIGLGICLGYIKHYLFIRVRNLMNMVDNYLVSVETGDLDETPVKVLERLDNLSTFDEESEPELLWDDIIAHNAEDIAEKICQNMRSTSQSNQSSDSTVSSIINVNLDDYFRAINHPNFDSESKEEDQVHAQIRSSTPFKSDHNVHIQNQDKSSTTCEKNVATAYDYPSFNISLSDSNKDISEDDLENIIKDHESTTRSGKRYKLIFFFIISKNDII